MQTITGSVGHGGANKVHDVALVQAMLLKIPRPFQQVPQYSTYLSSYDGACGPATIAAIKDFQKDYVFAQAQAATAVAGKPAPVLSTILPFLATDAKEGVVAPDDSTWQQLLFNVPLAFSDMRVLNGGKTVYLAATEEDCQASVADVMKRTFNEAFRAKVIAVIQAVFKNYAIAMRVTPDGGRRTFDQQDAILRRGDGATHAGPGESNHNYGQAADFGFPGLPWLKSDGSVTKHETPWLAKLSPGAVPNAQAMCFWNVLRSTGIAQGLFRGPESDRPHLQSWSDAGVNMGRRLADLLNKSGSMKWSSFHSSADGHYHYKSDLGLGGDLIDAGMGSDIWNESATITLAALQQAVNAAATRTGTPPKTVTAADVTAMKKELRRQFGLADANWQNWTPS